MSRTAAATETKAFCTPAELAEVLGVHPDTVLNYIHAGRVFAIKLSARTYRIPTRELLRLTAPERLRAPRIIEHPHGGAAATAAALRRLHAEHDAEPE